MEYAGTIRCSPRVQQVVFTRRHEPFSARREAQWKHAALVQVKLVFVGFGCVEDFNVRVFHADSEPITWKRRKKLASCQRLAVFLKVWNQNFKFLSTFSTYQSGNIQARRSVSWSRVVAAVYLPVDPMTSPCCQDRLSIISNHPGWCRCKKRRRYVLGTVAPVYCYSDPIRRCCHHYSTRNTLWSRARWLRRNKLVQRTSIRLWCVVSDSQDPRSIGLKLRRRRWAYDHRAKVSQIGCSCRVAFKGGHWN